MIHKPKILFNPTSEPIEFMCGGQTHVIQPGEKELKEGFIAYHALVQTRTGLVEYEGQDSNPDAMPLNDMPWRNLVSLGAKLGVHKVGMNRTELVKKIKELDGQEEGTV